MSFDDRYSRPVSKTLAFMGKPTLVHRIEQLEKQVRELTDEMALLRSVLQSTHHAPLLAEAVSTKNAIDFVIGEKNGKQKRRPKSTK